MTNMANVLAPKGLIVIYDFGITDRMVGSDDYTKWYQEEYLRRFPKPPRKENKWSQDDLTEGFIMEKQTEYAMEYAFELEKFVLMGMYANCPQALRARIWSSVIKEYDEPIILIRDLNIVELEEDR